MSSDLEQLQELYELMLEKNLDALEIKDEDFRVKLTRRHHVLPPGVVFHSGPHPAGAPSPSDTTAGEGVETEEASIPSITSPLPGVFYRASSPTSAPFVKEGDMVEPGQTLCIVEAMKVMNEIKAESRCKIVGIPAENGRPVSAGQALFYIEPV
jgi:acetyl-CoA carboxylase biotin carboxyl carrier protein